jgi:hypothetical protein
MFNESNTEAALRIVQAWERGGSERTELLDLIAGTVGPPRSCTPCKVRW